MSVWCSSAHSSPGFPHAALLSPGPEITELGMDRLEWTPPTFCQPQTSADLDTVTIILRSVSTAASLSGHVLTVLYHRWSLPVPANSPALSNILRYPSLIQHYTLAQWLPVIFGCEATSPKQGASTYTRHLHRQSFPDRRIASVTLESCHHKNLPLDALPTPSHVSMGDQNPRITIPCPTYS